MGAEDAAGLRHHLLRHRHADGHFRGHAAGAAAFFQALGHLEFHVVVQISHGGHAGAFVDRGLDLRRHGDVLEHEAAHLDPVFALDDWVDDRQQRLAQIHVARGHVEHGNVRGGERVAEDADEPRTHRVGEFVEAEMVVGPRDFFQEQFGIDDPEIIRAEGPHAHDAEVLVAQHDGVGGAPFVAGEQARGDVVDVGLEG